MHYATIIEHIADQLGDRTALVHAGRRTSWRQLDDRASRIAAALAGAGIGPGAKVGLFLFSCPEYLEVLFGALKMRAVPIHVKQDLSSEALEVLLRHAQVEALVFHASLASLVAETAARLPPLRLLIFVGDVHLETPGLATAYQTIMDAYEPGPRVPRSGADQFVLYTPDVTGTLQRKVYRIDTLTRTLARLIARDLGLPPASTPEEIVDWAVSFNPAGSALVSLSAGPLAPGAGC